MERSVSGVITIPSEARRDRIVRRCCRLTNYAVVLSMVMLVARIDRYQLITYIGLIALLLGIQIELALRFAKWRTDMFDHAYYVALAGIVFACIFVVECPVESTATAWFKLIGPLKAKLYFFIALLWALSSNRKEAILTVITAVALGVVWKASTLIAAALVALLIIYSAPFKWGATAGRSLVTVIFLAPVAIGIILPSKIGAIADVVSRLASFWHRVLIWEGAIRQFQGTGDANRMLFGFGWKASFQTPIVEVFHHGLGRLMPVGGGGSMHSSALTVLFDFGVTGLLALTGAINFLMGRSYGDALTTARMRAVITYIVVVCSVTLNFYYDYILIYLVCLVSIVLCQRRESSRFGWNG